MRILILGGNGMLGHTAWRMFRDDFDVYVTFRGHFSDVERFGIFDQTKALCGVRVEDFQSFERTIVSVKPDIILNCIGIVKQIEAASDAIKSIEINSLFPHKLALLCRNNNCRLIHLSTDCVFSGKAGKYSEEDAPDPQDLYGRSKLLGEVFGKDVLTIRTSMVGPELGVKHGLLEWFLGQEGKIVKGYTNAVFSGFTTATLCSILKRIIVDHSDLEGIYHVSSDPISKMDLLCLIKRKLGIKVEIVADERIRYDRSLDSSRFRNKTAIPSPSWETMVEDLVEELKRRTK